MGFELLRFCARIIFMNAAAIGGLFFLQSRHGRADKAAYIGFTPFTTVKWLN